MHYQLVLRAKTGLLGLGLVLALTVIFAVTTWLHYGLLAAIRNIIFPLALAFFTWWIWVFPKLVVDERGIMIRNQLRTIRISWEHFQGTQANFGLYILARAGKTALAGKADSVASVNERLSESSSCSGSSSSSGYSESSSHSGSSSYSESASSSGSLNKNSISQGSKETKSPEKTVKTKTRKFYSAAVPARGGFRTTTNNQAPSMPGYDFSRSLRQTLFVVPSIGARLIDQTFLHRQIIRGEETGENPLSAAAISQVETWWQTPNTLSKRVKTQILETPYQGIQISLNWWMLLAFVVVIGACTLAWTA